MYFFFFQAEDGIRDLVRSRGLGDVYKRQGYDPAHPFVEDLKRKDFIASVTFGEADACAPDFMDRYTRICREAAPVSYTHLTLPTSDLV